jgi:hypothetical protein
MAWCLGIGTTIFYLYHSTCEISSSHGANMKTTVFCDVAQCTFVKMEAVSTYETLVNFYTAQYPRTQSSSSATWSPLQLPVSCSFQKFLESELSFVVCLLKTVSLQQDGGTVLVLLPLCEITSTRP